MSSISFRILRSLIHAGMSLEQFTWEDVCWTLLDNIVISFGNNSSKDLVHMPMNHLLEFTRLFLEHAMKVKTFRLGQIHLERVDEICATRLHKLFEEVENSNRNGDQADKE